MTKKDTKDGKHKGDAKAKPEPKAKPQKQFTAHVLVTLKPTVNDPEGTVIAGALGSLGFAGVTGVRSGKYFQVSLTAPDKKAASAAASEMSARLLANPVIEAFSYEVKEA
jgi:phosphoribosylformylglycinamidine synthase